MATGIKDKVAILGMGCSRFGERWESGAEEIMVEAFNGCRRVDSEETLSVPCKLECVRK